MKRVLIGYRGRAYIAGRKVGSTPEGRMKHNPHPRWTAAWKAWNVGFRDARPKQQPDAALVADIARALQA